MKAPTKEDLEATYWLDFTQYFTFERDRTIISPDAPKRVVDSYNLSRELRQKRQKGGKRE